MVLPDLQIPYHDRKYVDRLVKVAYDLQPVAIYSVGDWMDFPEVSRWTKGLAGEYADTLQGSIDTGREVWSWFRDACPDADLVWKTGNHDERVEDFVYRYAPPLRNLRATKLESLFELEALKVRVERHPVGIFHRVAGKSVSRPPGEASIPLLMHGHEEAYSSVPGKWGLEQVKRQGRSVVYGHTHQPLLVTHTFGVGNQMKTLFAMNVGHGCHPQKMAYSKSGYFNWCRAFGLIHREGKHVYPELVTSLDGTVQVQGRVYP